MLILLLFPRTLPLALPRLQSVSVSLLPLPSPTIVTVARAPLHPPPPSTTFSPFLTRDDQLTLARCANKNTLAVGDMRQGEGTIGGKPPEAVLGSQARAHPSQDMHAVGHFVWRTFSSPELFSQNVWLNPVSGVVLLISVIGVMLWREVGTSIQVDNSRVGYRGICQLNSLSNLKYVNHNHRHPKSIPLRRPRVVVGSIRTLPRTREYSNRYPPGPQSHASSRAYE